MDFETLYKKICPKLKAIAKKHRYKARSFFIDEDDLHQEMCIHLWDNFRQGVPAGINEAYIIRGCEFHILNYLRKEKEKAVLLSLEETIDDNGYTLKDIIPNGEEPLETYVYRKITISEIKNNGLRPREKEVFSLLCEGYTVREAGKKLGISHVSVVKIKKRIIDYWRRKNKIKVTNGR